MADASLPAWTRLLSGILACACAWLVAEKTVYAPAGYDHFTTKHLFWAILPAIGAYLFGLYALTGRFTLERLPSTDDCRAHPNDSPWLNYRKRVRRFLWVFLGGGVFVGVLVWLISLNSDSSWLTMGPVLVWIAAWVVLESRLRHFPCPRCKEDFFLHHVFHWHWPFARSCLQCGLRKWEEWPL